jgi:hypothetical protein
MIDLEVKGIDADAIHLVPPGRPVPSGESALDTDVTVVRSLVRRGLTSGVLGALIGVAVVVGALALMRTEPFSSAVSVGAAGGALGGFLIGGFWGAMVRLPVNDEAFDTFVLETNHIDHVVVEVTVDDPWREADVVAVMRHHHAQQIAREVA